MGIKSKLSFLLLTLLLVFPLTGYSTPCFYGGWPSDVIKNKCETPWNETIIKKYNHLNIPEKNRFKCPKKYFYAIRFCLETLVSNIALKKT